MNCHPPASAGVLLPHPGFTPPPRRLAAAGGAWPFSRGNPLWPALVLALIVHVLLISALGFKSPRPSPTAPSALEVLVLRQADGEALTPEPPDVLADRAQEADGMADADEASRTSEPQAAQARDLPKAATADPAPRPAEAMTEVASAPSALESTTSAAPDTAASPVLESRAASTPRVAEEATTTLTSNASLPPDPLPADPLPPETLSAETTTALSSDTAPIPTANPLASLAAPSGPPPPLSAATILASRSEEIARLNAKLGADTTAYANRPRRKAISASTQEYKYASYLEAWRRKVEAIGNLNYPEEARRRKLYGNLILQVGVRADGSLEEVRVLRSSGSTLLDEAAVRIVHLAAPFAPFPPDIRRETDFLDITRTWQFLSDNRFGEKR